MFYDDLHDIMYEGVRHVDRPYLSTYPDGQWYLMISKNIDDRPSAANESTFFSDGHYHDYSNFRFDNRDDVEDVKRWMIARRIGGNPREVYKKADALLEMLLIGIRIRRARESIDIQSQKSIPENVGYDELLAGIPDPEPVFDRLKSVAEMWRRAN